MKKKVRNFMTIIEQGDDEWFIARVLNIPGCYTQGKTVAQALERIKEAIEVCLEAETDEIKPMKFIGVQQVKVET